MRRYRYLPPVVIVCAILGLVIARNLTTRDQYHSDSAILMDTVVEISTWKTGNVPGHVAVDSALAVVAGLDSLFGDGIVDTRKQGGAVGSDQFVYLIDVSRKVYDITRGRFDPTIGSVSRLWQFWEGAVPPPADSIHAGLAGVGLDRYLSDGETDDFVFDLGGIAKGYAVDLATETLRQLGFTSAIVNAGGDLSLIGTRRDGRPWRIAVRHPRQRDEFVGYLDLEDVCVATSGDYERCFISDGRRYHHILDPRTGMPGYASSSVTVVASQNCMADALATGLFLLGPDDGLPLVEAIKGVDAVFIHADGESVTVSSGLAGKFGRFEPE
jgi:thiamine biosynthesis lipoprotein